MFSGFPHSCGPPEFQIKFRPGHVRHHTAHVHPHAHPILLFGWWWSRYRTRVKCNGDAKAVAPNEGCAGSSRRQMSPAGRAGLAVAVCSHDMVHTCLPRQGQAQLEWGCGTS